jgi:hypothetical protein
MKIRTRLVILIAAVMAPIAILAAIDTVALWRVQRLAHEQTYLERVSALRLALDTELAATIRTLGWLSDSADLDSPERLRTQGVARAAWVDPALGAETVGKAVAVKLKLAGPLLTGDHSGDIFVDGALAPADRRRVIAEALAAYRAHPQVEAAFSGSALGRMALPTTSPDRWTIAERVRASFDPRRSGDLYVVLRSHVQPIAKPSSVVSTHGSPWDYDRRVPILLWRPAMPATVRDEAIATVDIMPTLAAMLGVPVEPSAIDGKCLTGISGVACPPR